MQKLFVIKIGGNILDDENKLEKFLTDFASIEAPKILVHGGGKLATKIGHDLGIESNYIDGRRITDKPTLDLVTMVYGGLINRQLVARLQTMRCNAIGVTGADGNLLRATKRPVKDVDYGFVGDIKPDYVNTVLLHFLLKQNVVPVFAPLTHSEGTLLNTNADTIASALAVALSKHFHIRLIYCFEKKGVLENIDNESSVIHLLTTQRYQELLQKSALKDGILPKLENAFHTLQAGVNEVLIGDAHDLLKNMGEETEGTLIRQ